MRGRYPRVLIVDLTSERWRSPFPGAFDRGDPRLALRTIETLERARTITPTDSERTDPSRRPSALIE